MEFLFIIASLVEFVTACSKLTNYTLCLSLLIVTESKGTVTPLLKKVNLFLS